MFSLVHPTVIVEIFVCSLFKLSCFTVANVINEMVGPSFYNMLKFLDGFVTDSIFISCGRQASDESFSFLKSL